MNEVERKKLNEMLKDNDDVIDNTHVIRDQKHSELIKLNVEKLMIFKKNMLICLLVTKKIMMNFLRRNASFIFELSRYI